MAAAISSLASPASQAAVEPLDPQTQRMIDRAMLRLKAVFCGSFVLAAGTIWFLLFSDLLNPFRVRWLGISFASNIGARAFWGVFGFFFLSMGYMLLWSKLLAWLAKPSRAQMEQALRQGSEQALTSSKTMLTELLADMQARGCGEQEIAETREMMENLLRKNHAESEARISHWLDHPDEMNAHLEQVLKDAQAAEAGVQKPAAGA